MNNNKNWSKCETCARSAADGRRQCWRCINLKKRYGVTDRDYTNLINKQAGKCAICGLSPKTSSKTQFVIDHDHLTGTIRGVLCPKCNKFIGIIEHAMITGRLNEKTIDYMVGNMQRNIHLITARSELLQRLGCVLGGKTPPTQE